MGAIFNTRACAGILLAAGCSLSHAQDLPQQARNAAIADGLTTALGLAAGGVEANPIGPLLTVGMKAVAWQYASTLPDTERPAVYAAAASMWQGAAANNLCVTAALLTGGSFAPACVVVGALWAAQKWQESEHERLFWQGCAMLRTYARQPELECIYTPPGTVLVTEVQADVVGSAELPEPQ
jgi:hypothetical protein